MTPFSIDGGILFFFAVGSTTELGVFMAGWGSNNKFSMLGAMRAIAQMVSYELPLIITVLPVVMVVGSLTPDAIVAAQGGYRFGVDPALVCLHALGRGGVHSVFRFRTGGIKPHAFRCAGRRIGNRRRSHDGIFRVQVRHFFPGGIPRDVRDQRLAVTLFLGGWHAPLRVARVRSVLHLVFRQTRPLCIFVFIWVRGTLPRTRVDQVMNFAWKFMLPMAFTCIIAAAVWHYAGRGARRLALVVRRGRGGLPRLSRIARDAERNLPRAPIASPNEQRGFHRHRHCSTLAAALAAATLPKLIHAALSLRARVCRGRGILFFARRGVRRSGPGFCLCRRGGGPDRLHDSAHPAGRERRRRFNWSGVDRGARGFRRFGLGNFETPGLSVAPRPIRRH